MRDDGEVGLEVEVVGLEREAAGYRRYYHQGLVTDLSIGIERGRRQR